jgi:hypothetical protein
MGFPGGREGNAGRCPHWSSPTHPPAALSAHVKVKNVILQIMNAMKRWRKPKMHVTVIPVLWIRIRIRTRNR